MVPTAAEDHEFTRETLPVGFPVRAARQVQAAPKQVSGCLLVQELLSCLPISLLQLVIAPVVGVQVKVLSHVRVNVPSS